MTETVTVVSHRMIQDETVVVVIRDAFPYEFVRIQKGSNPTPPVPAPGPAPKPAPEPAGDCSGVEGGDPFGNDQEAFYSICEPGRSTPTKMMCAEGTVWDTSVGVCNWPK